ncbi:MAG: D-tyrosyl-tRNA(Tyr) deacylase [Ignavibacteriales bacterium]|nr:D-tyrosyl-tRNA(Tyr) deacylase [Ignavibacteriales bacterium]
MRALIQRVKESSVTIGGATKGKIEKGMLILLGVTHADTNESAGYLAKKVADLRIFEDAQEKINLSVKDIAGAVLVISQFTLYADTRRGNRPSFTDAAQPEKAELLYNEFVESLRHEIGRDKVQTGVFRAMMEVSLINDGPVTIMLESK